MMNKQPWTATGVVLQLGGLFKGLTTPHCNKEPVTNPLNKPQNWTDTLVRPQQMNKDMALAEDRDQWRAYVRAVMNVRVP